MHNNSLTGNIPEGFTNPFNTPLASSNGNMIQRQFNFQDNPMSGVLPDFVASSVFNFTISPGHVLVYTDNTDLECPTFDALPPISDNVLAQSL